VGSRRVGTLSVLSTDVLPGHEAREAVVVRVVRGLRRGGGAHAGRDIRRRVPGAIACVLGHVGLRELRAAGRASGERLNAGIGASGGEVEVARAGLTGDAIRVEVAVKLVALGTAAQAPPEERCDDEQASDAADYTADDGTGMRVP